MKDFTNISTFIPQYYKNPLMISTKRGRMEFFSMVEI